MSRVDGLAAWMSEQIAEDKRVAGELAADGWPKYDGRVLSVEGTLPVPWPDRWNPVRVLAECDAKQLIVEECAKTLAVDGWEYDDAPDLAERTLRLLALPMAARPGYCEDWKP